MDWILTLCLISGQIIKVPFGMGGITLLDLAVIFILAANFRKLNFKNPPLPIKTGLIFLAIAALSLIFTPLHLTNLEILNSFSYSVRFFLYLLLGLVAFKNPLWILQISGISLAVLGLAQLIFLPDLRFLEPLGWDPHYFRTVSTFLDPNFLGAYLVLTLLALTRKKIFFALVYTALLLTFSRSSYLMFFVSFLSLSFLSRQIKMFILTIALSLGLLGGFYVYTQLISVPRGIDRKASASYRIETWQQGLTIFEKSPIFGVGFNSYRYAIREYNLGNTQFLNSHGSTTNDFSLLYVLATTGVLGLGAYLIFLASAIKTRSKIISAFLPGLLVHSIFNNSLFYSFILIWVIILSANPDKLSKSPPQPLPS